ncbi:sugar ABC transporter substrate-binding protein [Frankia gtarii]|uniref:sugar ABC transporter substrate-binding protein n=1 Tax=Frankia gtarii TaxID=2950102 RepID=UPI0021BFA25C|nr:substrate-binding domain-containing protein [Frankia gtarii]
MTSVLSGVIMVPLASVLTDVSNVQILRAQVPVWLVLPPAAALSAALVWLARRVRPGPPTVFLMMPAFDQKHWLAELLRSFERALGRRFDLVVKISDGEYTGDEQMRRLRQTLSRPRRYMGGFVIAADPDRTRDELASLCAALRYPIIFVDVEPFARDADYPRNTAFVGCSDQEIGERAACYLAGVLDQSDASPHVLVVAADRHHDRQRRFVRALTAECPGATVLVDEDGLFDRARAAAIVRHRLAESAVRQRRFDAIFCTSDEMALGALDALRVAAVAGTDGPALVVGVDGTAEARALIGGGGSPLCATVVQDTARVAERAVDLMERKIRGDSVRVRHCLDVRLITSDPPR